ncbi:hypothetical protein A6R68_22643 [Neotoma lepida]|uniref:Uncharacterized protein n=1 Tax=Neotoma lepida TaxID=56216 RepID=A0A1A6I062_NEOLE|nr:hypothetical protein A6R68_22643 [Neotoma lepida]
MLDVHFCGAVPSPSRSPKALRSFLSSTGELTLGLGITAWSVHSAGMFPESSHPGSVASVDRNCLLQPPCKVMSQQEVDPEVFVDASEDTAGGPEGAQCPPSKRKKKETAGRKKLPSNLMSCDEVGSLSLDGSPCNGSQCCELVTHKHPFHSESRVLLSLHHMAESREVWEQGGGEGTVDTHFAVVPAESL